MDFISAQARRWTMLLVFFMLSACSGIKHDLYQMAIEHERENAGLQLRSLKLDGQTISLLESDPSQDKPTLVLIHGFAANKDNWVRFARHLTDSYHVVAIDLPGHGDSSKDMSLSYGLDHQVSYLHEILLQLKLDRFHLAGNSMGGAISSLYAANYPEQVLSLTLFDPAGVYEHESEFARQLKQGRNPLIVQNTEDFDNLLEFALVKKPFIPWPLKSVLAERSIANKSINDKIFADISADRHQYVFVDELKKIKTPTLILWGKEDRVIHFGNADVFEQLIPGSRKMILEDIGHAPMIEIPEEAAKIYREFVQSI